MTEPFETPAGFAAGRRARRARPGGRRRAREPIGVPAWTDAHNFVDFAGAEAVVYGPGDFAVAHPPEEHIDVNEVVQCAEVFAPGAPAGARRELAPTSARAATAASICSGSSAADIWTRTRAVPSGTTGKPKPVTKTPRSSSRSADRDRARRSRRR